MEGAERAFRAMGTEIRVIVEGSGAREPGIAAVEVEALIHDFDRRLSRFRPDSELCRLNRDPAPALPASGLLRTAIRAGLWAAERSRGLVDPTLLEEIEDAGYASTSEELERAPLMEALADAPPRRPAEARELAAWRSFEVDDDVGEVRRPPGLLFDTGGTGKGLAADLASSRLGAFERFAVDCGGDIRLGAAGSAFEIEVQHPLGGAVAETLVVREGGVATSGLDANVWRRPGGGYAHHLLDPRSGRPAWTGLVGVTALAPTAVAAETLAKAALLSGPDGAAGFLSRHGGLAFVEGGETLRYGSLGGAS